MLRPFKKLLARAGFAARPDFLIIGAQKAGTTALHQILNQHSRVLGSVTKEIHYFNDDTWCRPSTRHEYACCFPLTFQLRSGLRLFESTPSYLCHPEVPRRLRDYHARLKLIILLRDPVERAFSAWTMYHHVFRTGVRQALHDPRSFAEVVTEDLPAVERRAYPQDSRWYFGRGLYQRQIEAFKKCFPDTQLLILESVALRREFDRTIAAVQDFIGVPRESLRSVVANESAIDETSVYADAIARLRAFYHPHNEALRAYLSRELPSFHRP